MIDLSGVNNPMVCKSCGKLWETHMGCQGLCEELQKAKKVLGDMLNAEAGTEAQDAAQDAALSLLASWEDMLI